MAFNQYNLERVHNQQRGGFDVFVYRTDDTIAQVMTTGYFDRDLFGFKSPGEVPVLINVKCSDGAYQINYNRDTEVTSIAGAGSSTVLDASQIDGALLAGNKGTVDGKSSIQFVGDSITEGNTSTDTFSRIYGIMIALDGQLYALDGFDQGVGGDTVQDVIDRISTIGASIGDVVSVQVGTNDVSAQTPTSTFITKLKQLCSLLFGYGAKKVVVHGVPNKASDATFPWDATEQALWSEYNAAIAQIDMPDVYIDTASSSRFTPDSQTTTDGTHLSIYGSVVLGAMQADVILRAVNKKPAFDGWLSDNLLLNPSFSGTGGTVGGNTTGIVADNWASGSNVVGATSVCSLTDDVFGDGLTAATMTLSGTGTGEQIANFKQSVSIIGVTGDYYIAFCRFKLEAGHTGISNVETKAGSRFESSGESKKTNEFAGGEEVTGVLMTCVNSVLVGGETSLEVQLNIRTLAAPIDAVIHFDKPVFRKLN